MSETQKQPEGIHIKITKNGPYLVYGKPILKQEFIAQNEEGSSWEYKDGKKFPIEGNEPVALCRCGRSKNAPFCDGEHVTCGFDGTETATKGPIDRRAKRYEGKNYSLLDAEVYCAFARFCDAYGQVWNLISHDSEEAETLAIREAFNCPAGRLTIKHNETGQQIEPKLEKSIGVLEDPKLHCSGPLYIKGGITIEGADGQTYALRNRVALCRCGESPQKPFCRGTHASLKWKDGIK